MKSNPPASVPSMAAASSSTEPSSSFPAAEPPATPRSPSDQDTPTYKWTIPKFTKTKAKSLYSPYFQVKGFDCRLLLYPRGDSTALPGHSSLYIQIIDPRNSKFDCYASFTLSILNHIDNSSKSLHRDSCFRFVSKRKLNGWSSFILSSTLLDPKLGFLIDDSLVITANVRVLDESVSFTFSHNDKEMSSALSKNSNILSGKFTWKIRNFGLFIELIRTQSLLSPVFQAGECDLRISVKRDMVNGVDCLSVYLESVDRDSLNVEERSCWCLFKLLVLNQKPDLDHWHLDLYGRFGTDGNTWDSRTIGWSKYMEMADLIDSENGFLVDDTVVFSMSFHTIKESTNLMKLVGLGKSSGGIKKCDGCVGKFTWRIENFTRLKDLLKKGKMTGQCVRSRRFQIGMQDFRLLVYPRGQSQPPRYLSMFLEIENSQNTFCDGCWSCFVNYQLSVVNQRMEEKSVMKESQNRFSKVIKDGGWHEFMTLGSLFDQNSGFLIQDAVLFSAEVRILKETFLMQDFTESSNRAFQIDSKWKRGPFTWKVENFLSFKEIMTDQKIFSKFFQVGGCELRIGFYESFGSICAYLECGPSAVGPDEIFWISYRMAVVNQKDPAKSLWKVSSLCTEACNNSVLQFMKVSDMLETDAGFLVREMVVFVCEILDYCPWFDFSELEVLESDEDALSTDTDELSDSEDNNVISGNKVDIFKNLLVKAGNLTYEDNPPQQLMTLKEKLQMDIGAIADILIRLRLCLDDPVEIERLLLQNKISSSDEGKQEVTRDNESSSSPENSMMGVQVLQRTINDVLLDIMVECCRPSEERSSEGSDDANSKPSPNTNRAACQSESFSGNGTADSLQSLIYKRLGSGVDGSGSTGAVQCSGMSRTDMLKKAILGHHQALKTKWPEPSKELLGMIVDSMKALNGTVPQGYQEPGQTRQFTEKIFLLLERAPTHLQLDLVTLVPKLVNPLKHPFVACALLDRLQKPDAEFAPPPSVLATITQLDFGSEVWELLLFQASELLLYSNNDALAATIGFIFTASTQCQHILQAVIVVNAKLRSLGAEVSSSVLNLLCKTLNGWGEIAEAMLREIDFVFELDENCLTYPGAPFLYGEDGPATKRLHLVDQQLLPATCHFSDIYILIEMLTIPLCAVNASQAFERGVAQGFIVDHLVAMVLERRHALSSVDSISYAEKFQHNDKAGEGNIEPFPVQEVDFTLLLGLAETRSLSRNSQMHGFGRMLYALLFRLFAADHYHRRMLKNLVDRAMGPADDSYEIALDILVFLVNEEKGIVRSVLSMMREVVEFANVERAELRHQLCAMEDENIRTREEKQIELSNLGREKAFLLERLSEFEVAVNRLKSKMKLEMDCSAREKKELFEQMQEVESQLKLFRSERDDAITKLSKEKKVYQDHLNDVQTQLSQLKSQKRHELKKVGRERNSLAERLKEAEAERTRFDEELKRYATEAVTQEEVRQSLLAEIWQLKQNVEEAEGEKQEKEEQLTCCKAHIDGMEAKLNACQEYIHSLEFSLHEEMLQHAPLYGVGLDTLSMQELETLSGIHNEGLRLIHAVQQQRRSPSGHPL